MNVEEIQQRNARYHITEGALYISTGVFISAQTVMPALIKRLGGSDVLIGTWPIVIYLVFFMPQVLSANYSSLLRYRKSIVLRRGFIQRLHILFLACVIAIWGESAPGLTLVLIFFLFISNQATAGSISPIWMDFLAKTTSPKSMGKLMGVRTSSAAIIGFLNGFVLTFILIMVKFPYNYALAFAIAFFYQMSSLVVQRKIVEETPSIVTTPVRFSDLFNHMRSIVAGNRIFRKFLIASALLTVSFSSAAFFTVAALDNFDLTESVIGKFTVLAVVGQVLGGVFLGWIADFKGTKYALVISGASLLLSIILALFATSVLWFYAAFIFFGVNLGSEIFNRYNFAVECASEGNRPMYVGLMNAWFAPFYLLTPFAGWLSTQFGYNSVFMATLIIGAAGIILLIRIPDSRSTELAISSK